MWTWLISLIVAGMTLEQKIGQMTQPDIRYVTPGEVRTYYIGSVLNGGGAWPGMRKDAALAEMLECREGARWLRVNSLRAVPGDPRPVCMTTAYLDLKLPGLEKNLAQLTGPISAMLEKIYGIRIARIEQSIQAVRLGKRQAKLLRSADGGPALRAIRRYYDQNGRLIELSNAIHPGDRFTYTTSLVRS